MSTSYHVYANAGAGDPINYASPVATVSGLTWSTASLTYPGSWSFAVRAFDTVTGLEEENLDASVTLVLDATGQDITNQPLAPTGVRVLPLAGGSVRVEWFYPVVNRAKIPTGFHVYIGSRGTPDFATPAATVSFTAGIAGTFGSDISGLSGNTLYTICVRAFNETAEETNNKTVAVTADATGPSAVVSLTAAATS